MCQNEVSWKLIVPSFSNRYVWVHHVSVCESTHNSKQHTHNIHSHSQHIDVNIQQYTQTQSTHLFQFMWEWSITLDRSEATCLNTTFWTNNKHVSQWKYQTHHNVDKLTSTTNSINWTFIPMPNKYFPEITVTIEHETMRFEWLHMKMTKIEWIHAKIN